MSESTRIGGQAKDLLATMGIADHMVKRGRPKSADGPRIHQHIILTEDTANFLEDTANAWNTNCRKGRKKRAPINRSLVIRGLLMGLERAGYRLEDRGFKDEEDLAQAVQKAFEGVMKAG